MCGLFGVIKVGKPNPTVTKKMIKALAKSSEDRGTDAGGLAFYEYGDRIKLSIVRNAQAISKSGVLEYDEAYHSQMIMGHTRATTQGLASLNYNNHPFPSEEGLYAFAHNGILYNDESLATTHKLPTTKVETDSYVVVRMLDNLHNGVVNETTLSDVVEQIGGSFNFTFLTKEQKLWIVKHNNPLYMIKLNDLNMYVYTSTKDIMYNALNEFYDDKFIETLMSRKKITPFAEEIKLESGDIISIDNEGNINRFKCDPESKASYGRYYHSVGTYTSTSRKSYNTDYRDAYYHYDDLTYEEYMDLQYGYNDEVSYGYEPKNLNLEQYLDYRTKGRQAIIFNGTEEEYSSIVWENSQYPNTISFYSYFKGKAMNIDHNSLLFENSKDRLLTPLSFSDKHGLPIKDEFGINSVDLMMSYVKRTESWSRFMIALHADIPLDENRTLHNQIKNTVVFALWLCWLYNTKLEDVNSKGSYNVATADYNSVGDLLDNFIIIGSDVFNDLDVGSVYTQANTWAHFYLNMFN